MSGYDDIINLPHHVSKKHKHMSMADRAAQFSPFMALVGFGDEVEESKRLTDRKIELSEGDKERVNESLMLMRENIKSRPKVTITYFIPDAKKAGGAYVTVTERVKKIDEIGLRLMLMDGREIEIEDILSVDIQGA